MKLNKLLVLLSTIVLTACNGGGGGSDNGGGGGGSYTLGAQWTNQIGSASGVVNTDNISYQPLSNTIYRLNQSNSTLCTISASANSSTAWDCSSAIGVTNTTLYTCSPISGYTGTGINATLLSNTTGWGNVGYTAYIDVSNYKVYEGCYSMYASENKVFVVGYTNSTSNPAAVFAQ